MSSCIIISFGWSWEFVSRAIVFRGGMKKGDKLLLVAVKPRGDYEAKRVREALYAVERFVESLGIEADENVKLCEVDVYRDFLEVLHDVSLCIAREVRGCDKVEFYLLGGMRMLVIAMLYAIDILENVLPIDIAVYSGPEDSSSIYEIPHSKLRISTRSLGRSQTETLLNLLNLGEATLDKLVDKGKSVDSVRKLLDKLIRKGFVEKNIRGRRATYRLTDMGRVLAEVYREVYGYSIEE